MGTSINTDTVHVPSEEAIRQQLDRILDSPEFQTSGRGHRFLSFVVDQTLAGRADYLKAFNIAMEVFGRDASFDAQSDPVVRIEAAHVRRALERYYLVAGGSDEVVITIPKGAYIPFFEFGPITGRFSADVEQRTDSADILPMHETDAGEVPLSFFRGKQPTFQRLLPATVGAIALIILFEPFVERLLSTWSADGQAARPTVIIVEAFEGDSSEQQASAIAKGLTDELISELTNHPDLSIIAPTGNTTSGTAATVMAYVVQGSVRIDERTLRIAVRLLRRTDSMIIWANSYNAPLPSPQGSGILGLQIQLAREIADKIDSSQSALRETQSSM